MITYKKVDIDAIDIIKPLWKKLRTYHQGVSEYFTQDFEKDNYVERKKKLLDKENVQIALAYDSTLLVGYLIASIDKKSGEIDSLFVDETYRGKDIGDELMQVSLEWLKSFQPEDIRVSVAYGNQVLSFYEKHGFLPRSVILKESYIERDSAL